VDAEKGDEFIATDDKDETEVDVDDREDLISAKERLDIRAKSDVICKDGDQQRIY